MRILVGMIEVVAVTTNYTFDTKLRAELLEILVNLYLYIPLTGAIWMAMVLQF